MDLLFITITEKYLQRYSDRKGTSKDLDNEKYTLINSITLYQGTDHILSLIQSEVPLTNRPKVYVTVEMKRK